MGPTVDLPEQLNIAERFLDARVREGHGGRRAILHADRVHTYADVLALANRFANVFASLGVQPEQRVIVALPDIPEYAGALFGVLKNGAVVVMVNCQLKADELAYFFEYTRAVACVVHSDHLPCFRDAAAGTRFLKHLLVAGPGASDATIGRVEQRSLTALLEAASPRYETFATHKDDAALWLFSGGTTGRPKAVVQTHQSFANTTALYGQGVLGYGPDDLTLSVPKLYFGYATGSNLFFPFSAGGACVLFPERCTAEVLFDLIRRHKPTILINVPTMVNQMVSHPDAAKQDLSSLRFATSAGEALPVELYHRWKARFGVELLDGLGTAEMWHVFLTNRPGEVRPGTLGKVVPGFEVKVADDEGRPVPDGELGWLWVRGKSRAIGYWQLSEKTESAFKGEWYVSGDMVRRDAEGFFTYCGRGDDMLKVGGKWLAPSEVENCLLQHPAVRDCAVVGVTDAAGLVKPHAYVALKSDATAEDLKSWVREKLEPYKAPREVVFLPDLPRTHLGKVDRGALRTRSG